MHGLQQNMAMSEAQKQPAINALQQILSQKRQELMLVAPPADLPPVAASNPALAAALASIASGLKAGTAVAASGAQSANMNRVYVGSLHYDINEADIRMVFGQFGRIKQVDMSHEPSTGKSKGYCFVTYEQLEAADAAIAGMNGFQLAGRPIKVSRPASGAGGMGGGGGGGMPSSMAMPTASSSTSMAASASSNNPALVSYGEHMLAAAAPTVTGAGGSVDATVAAAQAAAAAAARAASMKPAFRVYVGCIPYELNAEHVRAIFGPFGLIRSVTLLPSQDPVMNPGQHRGYGFIGWYRWFHCSCIRCMQYRTFHSHHMITRSRMSHRRVRGRGRRPGSHRGHVRLRDRRQEVEGEPGHLAQRTRHGCHCRESSPCQYLERFGRRRWSSADACACSALR